MTKQELKENVKLRKNGGQLDNIQISVLTNSIYYFIESVYIMTGKNGYRLIVIQQRRLLTDEIYKTPRGARIAFLKFYGHKAWKEGVKANWSKFYSPLPGWCDEKMQRIKK
ncbi:MAG TPA: hypothetical protein VK469_03785 [Candidatus Kapabacteria bacterium]|nr:hypothetical protein [Candidatus Kapabacteria bacterium]